MDLFWKLLPYLLSVSFSAFMAWVCWSLRQLAKSEVTKIVDAAVAKLSEKDEAICEDVEDHGERLTKVEAAVNHIEDKLDDLPSKADLEVVRGEVRAVSATLVSTGEQLKACAAGIHRIEGHFIQHSRVSG